MEYGLIGEKLGHSYSKEIHELLGLYKYDLREIPKDELESFITSRDYKGLNVTIPYKEQVIPFLDFIDEGAKAIGAVNTIVNIEGKLYGYNTDYYGLLSLLKETGFDFTNKRVLVLGTGGTSKTAHAVLKSLKVSDIRFVSRKKSESTITYDEACTDYCDADFIVNTTPSGMYPNIDAQAIDLSGFKKLYGIMDVIYNPSRTKLMLQAEDLGLKAFGGLKMLVYQAVKAAELFTQTTISESESERVYKIIRNRTENIVLVGMPGVGKSTVGRRLSSELSKEFVDTDSEIVKREKREITDIFAAEGEKYFRDVEEAVVKECASMKNVIISTGGGAVLRDANVAALRAFGTLVFLNRTPENLVPTKDRPLADNADKMMKLYKERLPRYKAVSDLEINGDDGIDREIQQIKRYIDEH